MSKRLIAFALMVQLSSVAFAADEPTTEKKQPESSPPQSESPSAQIEAGTRNLAIQQVKPAAVTFDIAQFVIEGNTLLSDTKIQKALAPYLGAGRVMGDLNNAAEVLHRMYVAAGHPVVQVTPPAQTIVNGKVVLQVVEDRISGVSVTGISAFTADNVKASLPPLRNGKSLNVNQLESAITLANENSAKQISVNIKPGDKLGDVDATIAVNEDKVTKLMATMDNTGTSQTGPNKVNLAYQNANLFNRDHGLTVQVGVSPSYPKYKDNYSLSFGYHIPFYEHGVSVDMTASYSNNFTQSGPTYVAGKGTIFGGKLNVPLPNWMDIHQKLAFGADYKETTTTIGAGAGVTTPNITEIPGTMMYYAQVARPTFQGNGSVTYVRNLPGGRYSDTAAYTTQRPGAGPIWDLWRINLTGGYSLPQDWQARATVNGQFTNDLLIGNEQFGLGGATSVRGYSERLINADNGYSANLEVYTPEIKKLLVGPITSFRALAFVDGGRASTNDKIAGLVTTYELNSYGFGFRISGKKNTSLKFDLGVAQKAYANATTAVRKDDVRSSFSFSCMF